MPADKWPLLAEASALGRGALTVRRHADGRILVHGSRSCESNRPQERGYSWAGGELLPAGATMVDLVATIHKVHGQLASAAADTADREQWAALAEVIADLPEDL